jgi:trehalose 6-phosphate synthase/phosphatase
MFAKTAERRLIIVSNRLPMVVTKSEDEQWKLEPSAGGLINALEPVLRNRGGVWLGWPGTVEEEQVDLDQLLAGYGSSYLLKPVSLTAQERDKFYLGFSNEIIWPLFHDLLSRCNFDPTYWATYEDVNRKFAQAIVAEMRGDDYVWVHDYHLINVARDLRDLGVTSPIGFFLHIPFPPPDIFLKLPWRFQILTGLLAYDLIGFQTLHDRQNFVQCLQTLLKDVAIDGEGQVVKAQVGDRAIRLGSFPIGIDFHEFSDQAATREVGEMARQVREALPESQLIFSTDRLDYTKGIPQKLEAFRNALIRFPELHGKVTLIQVVVPSRTEIREYHDLKLEIEQLVSEINGQFTQVGWVPIHYIFRSMDRVEILAHYRASEIALITPLKDGMNLVAKEYCASCADDGCLILSEFAGAAAQLQKGALLVNPYDVAGMADAIHQAYQMEREERKEHMSSLRRSVQEQDIFWWVDSFLHAGVAHHLDDFPQLEDYIPSQ